MCYNTGLNTLGIGNAVPAGNSTVGSGDKFDTNIKKNKKNKKQDSNKEDWKDRPNIVYLKK